MLSVKQHIELRGDDPLAAVIINTNANAHLVANLALKDGVEAAMEQYRISEADVYAALMFYYDHQEAIDRRRAERDALVEHVGEAAHDLLSRLRRRA